MQNKATITCNAKSSQIRSQPWIMDDVDARGHIFHDLFHISRYLLNEVDVKLRLNRSSSAFSLSSGEASPDYRIEISDIYLIARKNIVNPAVIYGHNEMLKKHQRHVPVQESGMSLAEYRDVIHLISMRKHVSKSDSQHRRRQIWEIEGREWRLQSQPFQFLELRHSSDYIVRGRAARAIILYADGLPVGGNPLKLTFDAAGGNSVMFANLFTTAGKWKRDEGNGLKVENFVSGTTLFAFQLEPNFAHISLVKTGNVRLDVQFQTALTSSDVSCIVYSEGPGYFEINKERDIVAE